MDTTTTETERSPEINLLRHEEPTPASSPPVGGPTGAFLDGAEPAPMVAPTPSIPPLATDPGASEPPPADMAAPVTPPSPEQTPSTPLPVPTPEPILGPLPTRGAPMPPMEAPARRRRGRILLPIVLLLITAGGLGYYFLVFTKPKAAPVQTVAKPVATTESKPAAAATETTPAENPAPTPETTTAPATTPSTSAPQQVTVRAPHGLWLRSSATSANRGNIIGWMADGAVINVDQTGDFWWHGTYKGKTGYFASKYTK